MVKNTLKRLYSQKPKQQISFNPEIVIQVFQVNFSEFPFIDQLN